MKRLLCLIAGLMLLAGCAFAEQAVALPGGRYVISVPDELRYSGPRKTDSALFAYVSPNLEMDVFDYDSGRNTTQDLAQRMAREGIDTEIRRVNGLEMIVYRTVDPSDGALCIGYILIDGGRVTELSFWYATNEAAAKIEKIMQSIRPAG